MGLSRNKVAVPEGAAGTPPFWSALHKRDVIDSVDELRVFDACTSFLLVYGGLAQLARALAWHARGHRFDSDILHF